MDLVDATLALKTQAPRLDATARKAADTALAAADSALGLGEPKGEGKKVDRVLSQGGKIVSVKQDFGIAVVDLGSKQGVNIGMPFELMRDGKPVGSAMVLDVREHISGIFIHKFAAGTNRVAVGDLAFLQTQQRP